MKNISLILSVVILFSALLVASPLIDATLKNDIDGVSALLKRGVDKDKKDERGFTALDYAISRKYSEIAQILYSDDLNNFIFLRSEKKPIYINFTKDGFNLKDSKLDSQILVLGTITPISFEEVCQSYGRSKLDTLLKKDKKFHLFLVASRKEHLKNLENIKEECGKFTTILYPNYRFYQLLERLFKYQGVPQFLFRDKSGKLTGGSIESYIFEGENGFTRLMK